MNDNDTTQRDTAQRGALPRDAAERASLRDETMRSDSEEVGARSLRASGRAGLDAGFLPQERMDALGDQWDDVQAAFVDDPRSAVQRAQQLVGDLVNELTQTFSRERETLEGQWGQGGQADTETLRVTLQRYRSFFNRLLRK